LNNKNDLDKHGIHNSNHNDLYYNQQEAFVPVIIENSNEKSISKQIQNNLKKMKLKIKTTK